MVGCHVVENMKQRLLFSIFAQSGKITTLSHECQCLKRPPLQTHEHMMFGGASACTRCSCVVMDFPTRSIFNTRSQDNQTSTSLQSIICSPCRVSHSSTPVFVSIPPHAPNSPEAIFYEPSETPARLCLRGCYLPVVDSFVLTATKCRRIAKK